MKKLLIPGLSLLLLGLIVAWMADLFNDRIEPGLAPAARISSNDAVPVGSMVVPMLEKVAGTISAKQATDISSRILARIETIKVRAGDSVKKGDLLVSLEQTELRSRKAQADARITGVTARLQEADKQLRRMQELFAQGMVARAELDRATANQQSLQSEAAQAQRMLEEMQSALAYSQITAPIDGRVIDRYAEPGDTASPGSRLLSLYNPLSLRVDAHVREQLALALKIGDSVAVEVPSLGQAFTGTVEELVPAANPGARSFQIKVSVNYAADLLPGMFARLIFKVGEKHRLLVAADRVASVGQLDVVWINQDGQILKRLVKTGKRYDNNVEILAGLNEGDLVLPVQRSAR